MYSLCEALNTNSNAKQIKISSHKHVCIYIYAHYTMISINVPLEFYSMLMITFITWEIQACKALRKISSFFTKTIQKMLHHCCWNGKRLKQTSVEARFSSLKIPFIDTKLKNLDRCHGHRNSIEMNSSEIFDYFIVLSPFKCEDDSIQSAPLLESWWLWILFQRISNEPLQIGV